jgi:TRAP-type C4-dicarboxylate transport system permease small subunit
MDKLLKWIEIPIHIFMGIALLAGFFMMVHISADVAGRAFYHPILGTNEVASGYYMILVAYLPWAMVSRNDQQIIVELFTLKLPPRVVAWLDIAAKILTIGYVAVFSWQTWLRALHQMAADESIQVGGSYLAVWPSRFVLPAAGGLMVLYLVLRVARDAHDAIGYSKA